MFCVFHILGKTIQYNFLGATGMMVAAVVEEDNTTGRVEEGLTSKSV